MGLNEDIAPLHWFAHDAMATTFQIALTSASPLYAQQAARAAFEEIDRLERELSRFIPDSDIARINRLGVGESVKIGADAFECLTLAAGVWRATSGAFDVTFGGWLTRSSPGAAGSRPIGMDHLVLDPEERLACVRKPGLIVDLGAIGKGYAVDAAADVLADWEISSALIHSGQSTVLCIGSDPSGRSWKMPLRHALRDGEVLGWLELASQSLSGSGQRLHGAHILDPRTGRPADSGIVGAWATSPSAAISDALSTAFMILSSDEVAEVCRRHPDVSAIRAMRDEKTDRLHCEHWGHARWELNFTENTVPPTGLSLSAPDDPQLRHLSG